MLADLFRLSLRSLYRRKLRSWLTLVGIIIGITSVVGLIGLGHGLEAAITGIFGNLGTDKITVSASGGYGPPGSGAVKPITKGDLEKIKRINGVKVAAGRLIEPGKLEFNERVSFVYVASIPKDNDERELLYDTFDIVAEDGRLLKPGESKRAVIGSAIGERGDFFGKDIVPGKKVKIQDTVVEVVGVLKEQGNPLFDSIVMLNEDDVREIFDLDPDEYDIFAVQVVHEKDIASVAEDIEKLMRKQRDVGVGEEDFSVSTPQDTMSKINTTLTAVQWFVYVIAGISILVGGIGIMNTMFMSVTERIRDIGIMKAIGATNSTIFMLFFIESGLLGSIGGFLGAIFGASLAIFGAAQMRAFIGGDLDIRADISLGLFFGSVAGSFLVGSFFGVLPAIRASGLNPVDALRQKK